MSNKYKKSIDQIKASDDFKDRTISILEKECINNNPVKRKSFNRRGLALGLSAAVLVLALGITSISKLSSKPAFNFTLSKGVKAVYTTKAPAQSIKSDLVWLTEEEMVNQWSDIIVSGTVKEIKNIRLTIGDSKSYNSIVTLQVDQAIKGDAALGSTVQVLMPCPIGADGYKVEDTDVAACLSEGSKAILLAKEYDKDSIWQEGGGTLYLMELCPYGVSDGLRFVFTEKDNKLIYESSAWNISDGADIPQVMEYLKTKMK